MRKHKKPAKKTKRNSCWNLYWVESDGEEDCFIVAQNMRAACRIECDMNGFSADEVKAHKIARIPDEVAQSYAHLDGRAWPWYVHGKGIFEGLGAQFRTLDGQQQMLLDDVVYTIEEYAPTGIRREYSIGPKGYDELRSHIRNSSPEFLDEEPDDDDILDAPATHLITMIGMCLVRCQQIEDYISHAFLLGISKKQKSKYDTLNDLREGWKRKTLGNLLQCIEEAWEIDPVVKESFYLFLSQRNLLVHGITTSKRYNIQTYWGRQELFLFLCFFEMHSRIVRRAFRAALFASLEFGVKFFGLPEGVPPDFLHSKHKDEAGIFIEFFTPKKGCI